MQRKFLTVCLSPALAGSTPNWRYTCRQEKRRRALQLWAWLDMGLKVDLMERSIRRGEGGQTELAAEAKVTEGVSIDDYSTWRAVRFADRDEIG